MGNWGSFEFNNPYVGEPIESVNGIELPKQYLDFMREHNGGEGDIDELYGGKITVVQLVLTIPNPIDFVKNYDLSGKQITIDLLPKK